MIGSYRRPWNARSEVSGLAPGIPREVLWAKDSNGIDQIGCIYTAQGFEFDYVGVIWGQDIAYDFDKNSWSGNKQSSYDSVVKRSGDRFLDLVKNTYRVLLSRGMKGCYVCFLDKDTERLVRSRTEGVKIDVLPEASDVKVLHQTRGSVVKDEQTQLLPFRKLGIREAQPFKNCVPLVDLKLAAGKFSEEQEYDEDSTEWVELPPEFRPQQGLFVAQVVGESMNRRIPNGSWCLFRKIRGGTRQGKVVVAQHREISDVETGGHFTVKVYESVKTELNDGTWKHARISLNPDTTASGYEPIVLDEREAEDLRIIAELVAVLG
ncbi:MAG: hypothetical protein JWR07_247 [Nevskia sp.]|nr:hypothetical protein [Nevskia sp.]